ncbi:hypothetical protein [Solirubrobacter soli]|uniref:hypothetical protein n=1 Tax=Solirubrobacter soli TaxID=363832 RepID=UPI000404A55A|nr:hypothetical protein [Solirubrobacter soli]
MTTLRSVLLATLALAVCAGPADAASSKHRKPKAKRPAAVKVVPKAAPAATPAPAPAPAPTPAPTVNSVISIGGYVFYNLTYAEAVAAYEAAVAAAPAGYTPPPVTSVSVTTTVGGQVS